MYSIKMNEDKSLETTIQSTIYQHERNADTLVFLLPKVYEEENLADCTILLRYIMPDGTGRSEELEINPEPHNKEYYLYRLKFNSELTAMVGTIELWLSIINMYDNLILKTGSAFIEITPAKDISDYLAPGDLNQLDKLAAQVEKLKLDKADGLSYNDETRQLQLTSNNATIGNAVTVPSDEYDDSIVKRVDDEWSDMSDTGEDTTVEPGEDPPVDPSVEDPAPNPGEDPSMSSGEDLSKMSEDSSTEVWEAM